MPYNTRRKSLSLPSLGINLPTTSRSSHRSPSVSKPADDQSPPSKKVKRSHDSLSPPPDLDAKHPLPVDGQQSPATRAAHEPTPPPSPDNDDRDAGPRKIDTDGIDDDIVVSAIEQLEKTGNRPHLVRELASILATVNETVANSANPAALLASRLNAYMKRPWSALSPCPIGKALINVHPRKVFYYLTAYPHQPLPENFSDASAATPGASTPASEVFEDDEMDARERSPSPEIDLSEFDGELNGQGASDSSDGAFGDARTHRLPHSHRAASPPLEGDEKEFTQTASSVRERTSEDKASRRNSSAGIGMSDDGSADATDSFTSGSPMDEDSPLALGEGEDYFSQGASSAARGADSDEAAAAALFGTSPSPSLSSVSSSLSSGTTATTGQTSTGDVADGLLSLKQNIAESARGATPASVEDAPSTSTLSSRKRSIDMVEGAGFPIKTKTPAVTRIRTYDDDEYNDVMESWRDLRDPETVEVDELDEMFADI